MATRQSCQDVRTAFACSEYYRGRRSPVRRSSISLALSSSLKDSIHWSRLVKYPPTYIRSSEGLPLGSVYMTSKLTGLECRFNITMDPAKGDIAELSTCTTCRFKEDKSNYWTAVLYFKHGNGSFIRVPQIANDGTGAPNGGMTIYYIRPRPPAKDLDITIFPEGFRMRVGAPNARRMPYTAGTASVNQTTFRCWDGTGIGPGTPGVGALDSVEFPAHQCEGGIRSQVYFPQCWDGKNLDSDDHESHVAHPSIGDFSWQVSWMFGTDCPASHPIRIPLLFMETVWDTKPFNDPSLWPADGSQPLVWSMGDPTGYGHHADYVFGWEREPFARAMESRGCLSSWPYNCDQLTTQTDEEINECTQRIRVPEVTEGQYLEKLPGCNPIQAGPEPATAVPNCDAVSTTIGTPAPTQARLEE
ncbi:hypothetical protein FA13DRAFT_1801982 [Coprinellus micaceus]|uniref:DUF1996 domain-containing protein n=1 Tax=Coprinellus micaceus TaxID=71717 RepID=A0A4Y7SDA6_COPMI|nr:hypothetical protein FA13DRAFT_1801982 [Coprinellus micaceus]